MKLKYVIHNLVKNNFHLNPESLYLQIVTRKSKKISFTVGFVYCTRFTYKFIAYCNLVKKSPNFNMSFWTQRRASPNFSIIVTQT